MGISYEYDTTIYEMIKDLQKLAKKHGPKTILQLPNPGMYDPYFEGANSKLTAVFSKKKGRAIITQKDID